MCADDSAYNAAMRIFLPFLLLFSAGVAAAATALYNVSAYTSSETGLKTFSVLLIGDDGRTSATGGPELLARYPDVARVDGGGRTLLPGLTDAHAHMYGLGLLALSLDLAGTPSLDDALRRVAEFSAGQPHADWIQGRGWNQVLWPVQAFPSAADLDRVVSDRPVWLIRIDGHAGWANSATLRRAGIDDDTLDPIGGKILRDANGHATGVLIDKAMNLVTAHIPAPGKNDIRTALQQAIATLLPLGVTGVHDAGIDIEVAEVYIALADDAALAIRIYAMLADSGANLDAMGEPLIAYGNDHLDIRAVKIYADGALGSRGAALLEPYSDDAENRGLPFVTADELVRYVGKANGMGFQVGIHAIGDRGNRLALDAFERVQNGRPSALRNRVEHAQIIALDDIPRFAELGVIAAMQATHATSDMNMAEDRVGPERIKGGYAWQKLLRSGAVIASGSDFPVELPNPFYGLHAAVTRQDRSGLPAGGWYAEEAMSRAGGAALVYACRGLCRAPGTASRQSRARQVGRFHHPGSRLLHRTRRADRRHPGAGNLGRWATCLPEGCGMIIEQIWTGNAYRNFNYLVACPVTGDALAIDPLDHAKCLATARERGWSITQILNTHEHGDHTGGNKAVVAATGAKLIAHRAAGKRIAHIDRGVGAGDIVRVGSSVELECLDTPGHTMSHICLLSRTDEPALFSGDTLFNAGAGNCHNGGHPDEMYVSFRDQLAKLADTTRIFPGHDYLANNLRFTLDREPDNKAARRMLDAYADQDPAAALVTTLAIEREINTFFRLDSPSVIARLQERFPEIGDHPDSRTVFLKLRELRNAW